MDNQIDFLKLASALASRARDLVPSWLPGGKLKGSEYCCGDLTGKPGDSMRVNIDTGKWADFAGNSKGGDLISLYAAIHNLSQIDAAKALVEAEGLQHTTTEVQRRPEAAPDSPVKPPKTAPKPDFNHSKFGLPVGIWTYKDAAGETLFHVARYDTEEGKQLFPVSWIGGRWQFKGWAPQRPLYGLDELAQKKGKPVLIVEGEKSCEAARKIAGEHYAVVTWPNGSKAVSKADWTPLHGRNILIWPDADEAGMAAACEISTLLKDHCQTIKVINPEGKSKGWDAADALSLGWTWNEFKDWAKSRVEVRNAVVPAPATPAPAGQTNIQVNNYNIFAEDVESVSGTLAAVYERIGVATTKDGAAICNADAALRVIEGIPEFKDLVWFDEFHGKFYTSWQSEKPQEWTSYHDGELMLFMQRFLGMRKIGLEHIKAAVNSFAMKRVKNEPRDWMAGLKWDGKLRINDFMHDVYGVTKTGYSLAVSKNFWIGMAARVFHPGCKLDNMVVLEGGQGIGKTTSLEIIGGPWFTDMKETISKTDFFMCLQGKLVIEIAELDSFGKADVTRIKQIITSRVDRYRSPYGHRPQDNPRMCVFVGTTNETQWQRDHTGGRRFWPITCRHFNLETLRKNRDQYFAEAVQRLKDGEDWYETPHQETLEEQEARRHSDEWEDIVRDYIQGGVQGVLIRETSIRDIAVNCLRIDAGKLDMLLQRRIGKVLNTIGWEKKQVFRNGTTQKIWVPMEEKNNETTRFLKTENLY